MSEADSECNECVCMCVACMQNYHAYAAYVMHLVAARLCIISLTLRFSVVVFPISLPHFPATEAGRGVGQNEF